MVKLRKLLLIALAIVSVSVCCEMAQANGRSRHNHRSHHSNYRGYHHTYRSYRGRGGYSRGYSRGYSPVGRAYADMLRANAMRAAAVRAAQADAQNAYSALTRTRTKIEREFKFSPQLTGAEAELDDAHRQLEKAHSAVRERLESDPAYRAAKQANDAPRIETLQLTAYRKDSATQDAQEVVYRAAARVSSLKKQFEGSVTSDPQWRAASNKLAQARANVARAQTAGYKVLAAGNRTRQGRIPHR